MKARIIQPAYTVDFSKSEERFAWELTALDACDPSLDLILLPEYSDLPALPPDIDSFRAASEKHGAVLLRKARETAARCGAVVFFNALCADADGPKNTTWAIDRQGRVAGRYFKRHPVASEIRERKLDHGYCDRFSPPEIVVIDGVRYAFLTCYDFYFYEAYSAIAREEPDVIVGCSHQRSDTHAASEIFCRFLAYNTNAYVLRASVSMGESSEVGGGSMAVAPDGRVLAAFGSRVGSFDVEFDPHEKYGKPAGFGNPPASHPAYAELGRRPWQYRPAGPGVCLYDEWMPYPRVCAHRGLHLTLPENSLPALGAAVGLGAAEIEFDVRITRDGVPVSIHDDRLERVSNGEGLVEEKTFEELRALDFGARADERLRGLRIPTLEEILRRFGCRTVMNMHLKTDGRERFDERHLEAVLGLIRRYDCRRHLYVMCSSDPVHEQIREADPGLARCMGVGSAPWEIVERAIRLGCAKVQLFKPYFDDAMIRRARENGVRVNLFYANDPAEAVAALERGVDTILTDNYVAVADAVRAQVRTRAD